MEVRELYQNVYYGTIAQILGDLIRQTEDLQDGIKNKDYCYGKEEDPKKVEHFLSLIKPGVEIYFGEGGMPLPGHDYEDFVRKNFPDIVKDLKTHF